MELKEKTNNSWQEWEIKTRRSPFAQTSEIVTLKQHIKRMAALDAHRIIVFFITSGRK